MPVDLPPGFVEKYSKPAAEEHPAPKQTQTLNYLTPPADTQEEREQLSPAVIPSTRQKIDPEILNRLTVKQPLLATTPSAQPPSFEPGKKVFTDQKQLDKIIAEAPEEGRVVSFKEAFKRARQKGLKEFEYHGDRFNTQQKDESPQEWLITLTKNKTPQNFQEYMERAHVLAAEDKKIDLAAISTKLGPALGVVSPLFQNAGITPEITSGQRNWGDWSLHEVGEAIDMRLKTADPQSLQKLEKSLPGEPTTTTIEGEPARMWTDGDFQYFIYGEGDNLHLHVERDTEESKKRLVEHMIKLGKKHKIPQKDLDAYLHK